MSKSAKIKMTFALSIVVLTVLGCMVTWMTSVNPKPSEVAQQICHNLVSNHLIEGEEECVSEDYLPYYIRQVFPEESVDKYYVTTAMQGFEVTRTQNGVSKCVGSEYEGQELSSITYVLLKDILGAWYVSFTFCDDILARIDSTD